MKAYRSALVLLVAAVACQDAQAPEFQPELAAAPAAQARPRFIVTLRPDVRPEDVAAEHGVVPDFVYSRVMNGFAGSIQEAARAGLLRDARVLRIERDVAVQADTTTQSGATWGIDRIDQRGLPLNTTYRFDQTGAGVTAYIVDTGIRYSHSEFGGRASFGFDAFGGDGSDCHSHGTHVAGTVGGAKYGVAKGVKLISVRVMDCSGSGSGSSTIAGLDWIAKNGPRPGVANLSLGGGISTALDAAIKQLFDAGIVAAVSAGNSGTDACTQSPARAPEAMTTGATQSNDARASYSNYGSCVDWFAPGSSITSACYTSDTAACTKSGTSMASPHSAAVAALYLAAHPKATPKEVRDGVFAQTTKGVVTLSSSANNHLLYSFGDGSAAFAPPPANSPPTAAFSFECVDLDCSFTDQSFDVDGAVASWWWTFGDGTTSTERHPKHGFLDAGVYQVKLEVSDDAGATASASKTVTTTLPPKISLSTETTKVKGNNEVQLRWSGATTSTVDIIRNGAKLKTVPNSGAWIDTIGKGNPRSYGYTVCEIGTGECSRVVYPN